MKMCQNDQANKDAKTHEHVIGMKQKKLLDQILWTGAVTVPIYIYKSTTLYIV